MLGDYVKKIIIILFLVSLGVIFTGEEEEILIPGDAIRFRVIANSNSLEDQAEKMVIKEQVEKEVYQLIEGVSNSGEVRKIIKDNLDVIEEIVKDFEVPYQINYGNNYFPVKNYKGVMYPAGNYESLVITLGSGAGKNFWCVLFPPLCLLEQTGEDMSDVEYTLYVKELLDKF